MHAYAHRYQHKLVHSHTLEHIGCALEQIHYKEILEFNNSWIEHTQTGKLICGYLLNCCTPLYNSIIHT